MKKYIPDRKLDFKKWFLVWNHWKNPFGNWHEPLPFPAIRREQGPKNDFLAFLWWQFWRNPLHNFTHFTIGYTPVGERYDWIDPVSPVPDKVLITLFGRGLVLHYSERGSARRLFIKRVDNNGN